VGKLISTGFKGIKEAKALKNNYSASKEPKRKIIKMYFYKELFFF